MIIVHSYCSYKNSPVGFNYGTFIYSAEASEDYKLTAENKDDTVKKSFTSGIIKTVCGKFPDKDNYIFLAKKLRHSYEKEHDGKKHDPFGSEVYINIAFEFDSRDDFRKFYKGFNSSDQSAAVAECIKPDIDAELGKLRFDKEKFNSWIEKMLRGSRGKYDIKCDDDLVIAAISSSTDYSSEIKELYGFSGIVRDKDTYFRAKKKTIAYRQGANRIGGKKIMMMIIAAGLILVAVIAAAKLIQKVNTIT